MADVDGKPKDVNRELVGLFNFFDENTSRYLDHNIQTYASDPKGINKLEFIPADGEGNTWFIGSGFVVANTKLSINGYLYGSGPMMTMKRGSASDGIGSPSANSISMHTPHWHGNVVLQDGKRTDVVEVMPPQMVTVGMVPDNQDLDVSLPH